MKGIFSLGFPGNETFSAILACGVKVRVGKSHFHAKCLDCEGLFELKK